MKNAFLVRMLYRPREPRSISGGEARRQRALRDHRGQGPARYILHAKKGLTIVLADLVDRNDIRMGQAGNRLGFPAKALEVRPRSQLSAQDHLQRHESFEPLIPRLVHHAHAAPPQLLHQLIVPKFSRQRPAGDIGDRTLPKRTYLFRKGLRTKLNHLPDHKQMAQFVRQVRPLAAGGVNAQAFVRDGVKQRGQVGIVPGLG